VSKGRKYIGAFTQRGGVNQVGVLLGLAIRDVRIVNHAIEEMLVDPIAYFNAFKSWLK
jgi:hypothetical protein